MKDKWKKYYKETSDKEFQSHADLYAVDKHYFYMLGCVYRSGEFGFPMRDHKKDICGISWVDRKGVKWHEEGSRPGIYYNDKLSSETAFITDGPTETLHGLALGMYCIGYEHMETCSLSINKRLKEMKSRYCVVVVDIASRSFRNYEKLQSTIDMETYIIMPPSGSLEGFFSKGGTYETIHSILKNQVATTPCQAKQEIKI